MHGGSTSGACTHIRGIAHMYSIKCAYLLLLLLLLASCGVAVAGQHHDNTHPVFRVSLQTRAWIRGVGTQIHHNSRTSYPTPTTELRTIRNTFTHPQAVVGPPMGSRQPTVGPNRCFSFLPCPRNEAGAGSEGWRAEGNHLASFYQASTIIPRDSLIGSRSPSGLALTHFVASSLLQCGLPEVVCGGLLDPGWFKASLPPTVTPNTLNTEHAHIAAVALALHSHIAAAGRSACVDFALGCSVCVLLGVAVVMAHITWCATSRMLHTMSCVALAGCMLVCYLWAVGFRYVGSVRLRVSAQRAE